MTAGDVIGTLGSVPDWVGLIAEQGKAQESLKYNPHAFVLSGPATPRPTPAKVPASAASGAQPGGKSVAVPPPTAPQENGIRTTDLSLLTIRNGGAAARGATALAEFRVIVYDLRTPTGSGDVVHVVHLSEVRGFATAIGDQAEVEFSGQPVEGGYLLSVQGTVNEVGPGFAHFWCDFQVRMPPRDIKASDTASWIETLSQQQTGGGLFGTGSRARLDRNSYTVIF